MNDATMQTLKDHDEVIWTDLRKVCKEGVAALYVVETLDDGDLRQRRVVGVLATQDNLDRLVGRAETFASCGVPACILHIAQWGNSSDERVIRSRYFGAMS